jgi:cytochrome P450 family 4
MKGFETTASAVMYTLFLLALNPEHQRKAHEEVDRVFKKRTQDLSFADLADLKYVEMCVKEALRLYPPAPLIIRLPDTDVPLGASERFEANEGKAYFITIKPHKFLQIVD